jgi:hypothetical protein
MRFIVQVRIEPDTNSQSDVIDVAVIERDALSPATLGLTIEEAKGLLGDRYKSGEVRIPPIASIPLGDAIPASVPEESPVSSLRGQVHGGHSSRAALPRFVTVSYFGGARSGTLRTH